MGMLASKQKPVSSRGARMKTEKKMEKNFQWKRRQIYSTMIQGEKVTGINKS